MSIRDVFLAGVETAFSIFNDAVKTASYTFIVDNGFDDITETPDSCRIIKETFSKDDINLSFANEVQPTDIKGLVPFVDLIAEPNSGDTITIEDSLSTTKTFSVVAYELDPMSVLFTFLLRKA